MFALAPAPEFVAFPSLIGDCLFRLASLALQRLCIGIRARTVVARSRYDSCGLPAHVVRITNGINLCRTAGTHTQPPPSQTVASKHIIARLGPFGICFCFPFPSLSLRLFISIVCSLFLLRSSPPSGVRTFETRISLIQIFAAQGKQARREKIEFERATLEWGDGVLSKLTLQAIYLLCE